MANPLALLASVVRRGVLSATLTGSFLATASALELGLPQYPIGVDTLYSGDFPPVPGFFANIYTLQYGIGNIRDARGRSVFTNFSGNVEALGVRPFVVWDTEVLGGRPVTFMTAPLFYRDVHASIDVPSPSGPMRVFDGRQSRLGIGDVSVAQLVTWHAPGGWGWYAGVEAFLPSGDYERRLPFNIGVTNTVTVYPQAAITWRSAENDQVSVKAMYGISTRNNATQYLSGQHLIVDAAAGIGLSPVIGLDVAGFALVQTTDDKVQGIRLDRGARTSLFGLGPQLRINVGPGAMAFKYQREFGARDAPQGNRFYVQAGFPLYVISPPATAEPLRQP